MRKRSSSVSLLAMVLTVLLVVLADEIALSDVEQNGKKSLPTLAESQKLTTHNWIGGDFERDHIFPKRIKKTTRVGKSPLYRVKTQYQKIALLASAKTDDYQSILTQYSGLLFLYCVLQI